MFTQLINNKFDGFTIFEIKNSDFSFSLGWRNLSTAFCVNKSNDQIRVDIRLAFGDVTNENLVDFIDYNYLLKTGSKQLSEFIIVYLGFFVEAIPSNHVDGHYLIDKSVNRISHFYIDLSSDKILSEFIRVNYPDDFNLLKPISCGFKSEDESFKGNNFGLRTKGIFKQNLPGNPLISIIIPAFNSEAVIEQAIQSAIVQTYQNKEIIIVDGGSGDSTSAIVKKYEKYIDWFKSEPDKNIFDAINKGTYLSNGQYSIFIGSDDLLFFDTLENAVNEIKKNSFPDFIYGNLLYLRLNGQLVKKISFINSKMYGKFSVFHPSLFISKEVFEEFNGFDIKYRGTSDADFELKLITNCKKGIKVELFFSLFREGGTSFLYKHKYSEAYNIFRKHGAFNLIFLRNLVVYMLFKTAHKLFGYKK